MFDFLSAPVETTPPLHSTPQSVRKQPRSRRRSRSRGGSQGQLNAAIAQVSRLALEPALTCLPLCQRPLTRLSLTFPIPSLARSVAGNGIGDEGAPALAAILKQTMISNLKCAAAPECSLSCQGPLARLLSHRSHPAPFWIAVSAATASETRAPPRSPPSSRRQRLPPWGKPPP